MKRTFIHVALALGVLLTFEACNKNSEADLIVNSQSDNNASLSDNSLHESDDDYVWDESDVINITLNGSSIEIDSAGVSTINGTVITITTPATYRVTGSLTSGQLIVNTTQDTTVRLIMNGVDINSASIAPVLVENSSKTIIIVQEGTTNTITGGTTSNGDADVNAAIFSTSNLTIYGGGTLAVTGNYADGITSKDGLILRDCNLSVEATDDGVRGKDYLVTYNTNVTATAGGDGLKSDNEDNSSLGYVTINEGTFTLKAGSDAIQAKTNLKISGSDITITSAGSKGLKAGNSLTTTSGIFAITATNDAIHSDASITINGGTFTIKSSDDGIHAESSLVIAGGDITVSKAYEGLEAASMKISGGTTRVTTSDDGINTSGSNLDMSGGYLYINATGDGIDANGTGSTVTVSGGTIIVNGPTNSGNGALDYDGKFVMTGGFIVAAGSSGMAMAPSNTSTQYSLLVNFTSAQAASKMVHIQDASGNEVLTFVPAKKYQSIALSAPGLTKGTSYSIYLGGSSTGTATDGLYSGGAYTAGTLYKTFTVSSIITTVGSASSGSTPTR